MGPGNIHWWSRYNVLLEIFSFLFHSWKEMLKTTEWAEEMEENPGSRTLDPLGCPDPVGALLCHVSGPL